ncbi:MAG: protein kinase [Deltaproteobacteria bacterium]|nr:protein kinase [Deltaproteobacteria bacterium]
MSAPIAQQIRAVSAHDDGAAAAMAQHHAANVGLEYDRLVGTTLDGRYFIERKIGEGGMGVVFAARHAIIERPLAIKVLKKEVARDTATVKRFVQEAKAASRIGHPNIVDVTDFGTTPDGLTYSVMEYVDGQTLSGAIKAGAPFKLPRAMTIAAQIARALGAAHAKGIVHRDLKPENVFVLNRDGRHDFVKIVDFGIAKVTAVEGGPAQDGPRLTRAGAVFGTPEYMAPEQAAGRNDTDGRVDIYALGIILYEMVTGKVPHKADSMVRTLAMQMLDPIIPPSQVRPEANFPPDFEAMLMKALAKKREQRYPTMEAFLADLERASGGVELGTPVSASVSSAAPAYTVGPLPPGADPALLAASRTTARPKSPTAKQPPKSAPPRSAPPASTPPPKSGTPPPKSAPPRSAPHEAVTQRPEEGPRATSKRVANEPAFVERPLTFDHVSDDMPAERGPRSKVPLILLMIVLFAGIGIGAALLFQSGKGGGETPRAAVPADAALVAAIDAPVIGDATAIVTVPLDAGATDATTVATVTDAGRIVYNHRDGGGIPDRRVDAAGPATNPGLQRQTVVVEIITRPDEGTLYVNDSYRGPSGVHMEEEVGARARVRCSHPGYDDGFVDVVFDGKTEVVLCTMKRAQRCVDGLHNPFDDCPE